MATRSAAANRTDSRPVTGRVHVWKRMLVPVSEATNNLASFLWVQTSEVAPTASERAAKRAKLMPIKDENVQPVPTRARSVFALDTQMHDVRLVETPTLPEASAPSFPNTKAASQASGGTVTEGVSGPQTATGGRTGPDTKVVLPGSAMPPVAAAASGLSQPPEVSPASGLQGTSDKAGASTAPPSPPSQSTTSPASAQNKGVKLGPAMAPARPAAAPATFTFGGGSPSKPAPAAGEAAAAGDTPAVVAPKFSFGAAPAAAPTSAPTFTFGAKPATGASEKKFTFGGS
eukprot:jgi/Ulvmu1/1599/UM111_0027.1